MIGMVATLQGPSARGAFAALSLEKRGYLFGRVMAFCPPLACLVIAFVLTGLLWMLSGIGRYAGENGITIISIGSSPTCFVLWTCFGLLAVLEALFWMAEMPLFDPRAKAPKIGWISKPLVAPNFLAFDTLAIANGARRKVPMLARLSSEEMFALLRARFLSRNDFHGPSLLEWETTMLGGRRKANSIARRTT